MVPLGDAGPPHIWQMPNVVILAGPNGAGKTSAEFVAAYGKAVTRSRMR
jgi:ABC-type lipopolysaccharide export system ATPase subunit